MISILYNNLCNKGIRLYESDCIIYLTAAKDFKYSDHTYTL